MDSLYQGFAVGYIIAWRNPMVTLKPTDGLVVCAVAILSSPCWIF
nr:hypothetical protein [Pseudomonas marginalis]